MLRTNEVFTSFFIRNERMRVMTLIKIHTQIKIKKHSCHLFYSYWRHTSNIWIKSTFFTLYSSIWIHTSIQICRRLYAFLGWIRCLYLNEWCTKSHTLAQTLKTFRRNCGIDFYGTGFQTHRYVNYMMLFVTLPPS